MVLAMKPLASTVAYCMLLVLETAFRIISEYHLCLAYHYQLLMWIVVQLTW